ncbi:hypothetical protein BN8_05952 [Fibrisoma limi BUZ 3]|uniref:Uncharacterized protein n=1 Tax=Fibrisoma limi BUZ 3 TaxID=1185876 RepID=I2GRQ1_9BACT|nr:hypothetical protein [Fibrisoma limi]CCH56579.1 hypothetical protein BN8_05952 [Fibrisoma limi BUZ 3]
MSQELYYVVRYTGPFGYIKPWTAVRDERTFSQQFLTPSIAEGIRQKLGVEVILRHRLSYAKIDQQQERTQSRAFVIETKRKWATREQSILIRGVMLNPVLHLAFSTPEDAELAAEQHVCLCRNEDVLLPDGLVLTISADKFDQIPGFELLFGEGSSAVMVGYDRFQANQPMYGTVKIIGRPVGADPLE